MTVLYTKYKAENNAIYVKYGLKIYREVWKVWNFEMENV